MILCQVSVMPKNDHNEKINENNVVDYNLSLC